MSNPPEGFLPESEYIYTYSRVPIVCVDILIATSREFLLVKRINEPLQGEWFFPGGRIFKGETIERALVRKTKEELGLDVAGMGSQLIYLDGHFFDESQLGGKIHIISLLHILEFDEKPELIIDETQSQESAWFSQISDDWHRHIKKSLRKAGYN